MVVKLSWDWGDLVMVGDFEDIMTITMMIHFY